MRAFVIVLSLLLGALLPTAAGAVVRVVSSIPDFGALAQEVGGDLVSVTSLVRPTQDPHFLDAKPSFMVDLGRADLVLVAGMELEAGWLPPLLVGARNNRVQRGASGYLDCSTLISPLEAQSADRAKGDVHPGGNPHYWFDPRNGLTLARGIAERLARLDPKHAADYRRNAVVFAQRLESKIAKWRTAFDSRKGTKVVVYHRSWVYLLDFAGYVLQESFYPSQLSRIFAQKSGASLKVLPTMTGALETKSYIDLVDTLVRELTH